MSNRFVTIWQQQNDSTGTVEMGVENTKIGYIKNNLKNYNI